MSDKVEPLIVKLRMDTYVDRQRMVESLSNNGYKVWLEVEKDTCTFRKKYFICFENVSSKKFD